MGKTDNKSKALGDDPLAWLNNDNKSVKKKPAEKKKKVKAEKVKPKKENAKKKQKTKAEVKSVSNNKLILESSMVINNAAEFYKTLTEYTVNDQAVEIDASKVEIIDSAMLQLIFAFSLSLKEKGVKLSWYKPTESLLNKSSILGLSEQLGL